MEICSVSIKKVHRCLKTHGGHFSLYDIMWPHRHFVMYSIPDYSHSVLL